MADTTNGSSGGGKGGGAERLHRYVDGELDAAGKEALAKAAALDPMVRRRLEGLVEVKAIVREAAVAQTPEIDAAELWAKIEAGLSSEEKAAPSASPEKRREGLKVIPGGAKPTATKPAAAPSDAAGRIRTIGATVIGALAIAAVAWLAFRGNDTEVAVETPTRIDPPALEAPVHTEVVEVDFGTNIGTIFSIEDDAGDRYAVVWLDEAEPIVDRGPPPVTEESPN